MENMWRAGKVRFLSVEEVMRILTSNGIEKIVLGGYEPTTDPELKELILGLKERGFKVWLLTNGYILDEEVAYAVDGMTFSIKAYDDGLHRKITGLGNKRIMNNFRLVASAYPQKIVAETVYDGKYVTCGEVTKIARFISSINSDISYRIDPLVQERSRLVKEVDACIEMVRKILPKTHRIVGKGGKPIRILYPIDAEAIC